MSKMVEIDKDDLDYLWVCAYFGFFFNILIIMALVLALLRETGMTIFLALIFFTTGTLMSIKLLWRYRPDWLRSQKAKQINWDNWDVAQVSVPCRECKKRGFGTRKELLNKGWAILPEYSLCPEHAKIFLMAHKGESDGN